MSLNKFTDLQIGKDIKLEIGCTSLECENMGCDSHFSQEIDTGKVVINTADNKKVNLEFANVGLPGYVLHTDGNDTANVYWAPDVGSASGIVYSGAGTQVGRHLKSVSADGLTADNSIIIEDIGANTLDVGSLKVVNATDPTDPQDLTTKNYVDTQAVSLDLRKQFSTGLLSGGFITINGGDPTKYDISSGTGIIVDPNTGNRTDISWPSFTNLPTFAGAKESFIVIASTGFPQISSIKPTPKKEREAVYLGNVYTPDTVNISSIDNQPNTAVNTNNSLNDLTNTLNHLNKNGNIISSSSGLTIQKSSGRAFAPGCNFNNDPKNPNFISLASLDSSTDGLTYYMQNCSSNTIPLTTINPNNLDDGSNYPGIALTAGYWSVQRVYSSCSTDNKLHLMLGQYEYPTKDQAINNINSEGFDDKQCAVINKDCLIGLIAVQQGATDLTNPAQAEFLPLDKYGYSTKIDLSSYLTQSTADPIYVNVSGDTMNGLLTMDSANINLTNGSVIQQDGINTYQSLQRTSPSNIVTGTTAPSMSGNDNSGYGNDSLGSTQTGSSNSGFGSVSLSSLTTGSRNTAIGTKSGGTILGPDITTENDNVLIGYETQGAGFNNSITIGSGGIASKSNQCTLHNVTEIVTDGNGTCDLGSSTRQMKDLYLSGNANAPTAPTLTTHLTNKQYVDNQDALQVSKTGDDMSGNLNLTGTAVYQIDSENIHNIIDRGNGNLISKGGGGNISSGQNNIAFGTNNLQAITTTNNNIAIGPSACQNVTGGGNLGIGPEACRNGSGNSNYAIGDIALKSLTTGNNNFCMGPAALLTLQTGNDNLALGYASGNGMTSENDCVLLGNNTNSIGFSNTVVLGRSGSASKSNQCTIHNVTEIVSGSDNTCNLGSSTRRMKDLYLGGSINNLGVIGNSFTQTASNTNNTATTPFSLIGSGVGSLSFPANTLVSGTTLKFKMTGELTCSNNDDLTFQFFGYTTPNISCPTSVTGETFSFEVEFTVRNTGVSASTALSWEWKYFTGSDLIGQKGGSTAITIDTTTINTLDLINVLVDGGMIITSTTFTLDKSR
jgi:hypothetical protein